MGRRQAVVTMLAVLLACGCEAQPQSVVAAAAQPFDPHPRYDFSYSVNDALTGDAKVQREQRIGDQVVGHYSLVEPDGNVRTVKYTADAINGFNAVVERTPGPGTSAGVVAAAVPAVVAVTPPTPQVVHAGGGELQDAVVVNSALPDIDIRLDGQPAAQGRVGLARGLAYQQAAARARALEAAGVNPSAASVGARYAPGVYPSSNVYPASGVYPAGVAGGYSTTLPVGAGYSAYSAGQPAGHAVGYAAGLPVGAGYQSGAGYPGAYPAGYSFPGQYGAGYGSSINPSLLGQRGLAGLSGGGYAASLPGGQLTQQQLLQQREQQLRGGLLGYTSGAPFGSYGGSVAGPYGTGLQNGLLADGGLLGYGAQQQAGRGFSGVQNYNNLQGYGGLQSYNNLQGYGGLQSYNSLQGYNGIQNYNGLQGYQQAQQGYNFQGYQPLSRGVGFNYRGYQPTASQQQAAVSGRSSNPSVARSLGGYAPGYAQSYAPGYAQSYAPGYAQGYAQYPARGLADSLSASLSGLSPHQQRSLGIVPQEDHSAPAPLYP